MKTETNQLEDEEDIREGLRALADTEGTISLEEYQEDRMKADMDEKIVAVTGKLNPYSTRNLEIDRAIFKAGRDSFLDDVGNATIPLSEVYEKGRKAGYKKGKIQAEWDLSEGVSCARAEAFKAGEQLSLEKQGQAYLEGKQAGIREVVEWINENGYYTDMDLRGFNYGQEYRRVTLEEWQAKLKSWNIGA